MPKHSHLVLAVTTALLATAVGTGCGGSGQPAGEASAPASGAAMPAATASASPAKDAEGSIRARIHSDSARMMADIKAAEDRGDVVDGVRVGLSSNPYDYVGISPIFVKIVALGRPALPAIAAEILASKENGLREYLLAAAGAQIDGDQPGSGQSWSTGKEWARQYEEEH